MLCTVLPACSLCPVLAAPPSPPATEYFVTIEEIRGAASHIELRRPDGMRHVPAAAARIPEKTRVRTTEDSALKFRFEDGSVLSVGRATQLVIESAQPRAISAELQEGRVRALVPASPPVARSAPSQAQAPHRLTIRTQTATMGVRGTDLTVLEIGGLTSIHTLQGVVEVAHDPATLKAAPSYRLEMGQAVDLVGTGGREKPYLYDRAKYLAEYEEQAAPRDPPGLWRRAWERLQTFSHGLAAQIKSRF
jgi:hypothetical protein